MDKQTSWHLYDNNNWVFVHYRSWSIGQGDGCWGFMGASVYGCFTATEVVFDKLFSWYHHTYLSCIYCSSFLDGKWNSLCYQYSSLYICFTFMTWLYLQVSVLLSHQICVPCLASASQSVCMSSSKPCDFIFFCSSIVPGFMTALSLDFRTDTPVTFKALNLWCFFLCNLV